MNNWLNNLSPVHGALLVGAGGALGGLIGAFFINWFNPDHSITYWVSVGGFIGGFFAGLSNAKRKEKNKS